MKTYYHNTTADCPDNFTLGYISADGDWAQEEEDLSEEIIVKIVAKNDLLSSCESYDQFFSRIAKVVCQIFDITSH
jgi:hypothetical protein